MSKTTDQLRQEVAAKYDRVRNNPDLNDQAKQREIARAYLDHRNEMTKLSNTTKEQTDRRRTTLERDIFGLPAYADSSTSTSYRDALDRAERVDPRNAVALLKKAETSGDELLTRALLSHAFENNLVDVINTHAETHPEQQAGIEELWELRQPAGTGNSFQNFLQNDAAPIPPEINGIPNHQIEALATDGIPA